MIDNCEHLLASCAELIAPLLQSSARLRILATSREALAVPGEVIIPVPPLAVPPGGLTLQRWESSPLSDCSWIEHLPCGRASRSPLPTRLR